MTRALRIEDGGSPEASVAEVAAKLKRARVDVGYSSPKQALILNFPFVVAMLRLGDAPDAALFIAALREEARSPRMQLPYTANAIITARFDAHAGLTAKSVHQSTSILHKYCHHDVCAIPWEWFRTPGHDPIP